MGSILALVQAVITYGPELIRAGAAGYDLYTKTRAVIDEHRVPGDAEWDALDRQVRELQGKIRDTSNDV